MHFRRFLWIHGFQGSGVKKSVAAFANEMLPLNKHENEDFLDFFESESEQLLVQYEAE